MYEVLYTHWIVKTFGKNLKEGQQIKSFSSEKKKNENLSYAHWILLQNTFFILATSKMIFK